MNICNYINQMMIVKYVCLIITIVYNLIAIIANVKMLFVLIVCINTFISNVCICKIIFVWSVKKKSTWKLILGYFNNF